MAATRAVTRIALRVLVLSLAVAVGAYLFAVATGAQVAPDTSRPRPDLARALGKRAAGTADKTARPNGRVTSRQTSSLPKRPTKFTTGDAALSEAALPDDAQNADARRRPRAASLRRLDGDPNSRLKAKEKDASAHGVDAADRDNSQDEADDATKPAANNSARADNGGTRPAAINTRIPAGTSLSIVLHTSQLSTVSSAGTNEQFADTSGDLIADRRTTFDRDGGSFDSAVGPSGARYNVFTATDDRGTFTTSDDVTAGILVLGLDTNGDFTRDLSLTYDLRRDFGLPSAASVVAGTSRAGREFVVVSSSGYYNHDDPRDPDNEPTAGVVLLVRDQFGHGFDTSRSRTLVRPGDGSLNNANALALLPNGDLLIADFDSNELRRVRDGDRDGVPDTLDPVPYYSFRYSTDAPLEVAANSRGVVFTHSAGNSAVLLALYDTNADGYADSEDVVVEGLSIDNNLILHGLTIDREGTVYVIEDATGASDRASSGGNGGTPVIDAFPDPALNGILHDGELYAVGEDPSSQALSGLAFGTDSALPPVARLAMTNSASQQGASPRDGLATITGNNLTRGRAGRSEQDAAARGVVVTVEGRRARVLSFDDARVHIHVPAATAAGANSVVVWVDGFASAADDATIANANPGLFTTGGTGAGRAVALLASGMRHTTGDLPARFNNGPSVVALFGTGWRNSLPVTAMVGGRAATVEFAGATEFPGLDQINVRLPEGIQAGTHVVRLTTAGGAQSRGDVTITIR